MQKESIRVVATRSTKMGISKVYVPKGTTGMGHQYEVGDDDSKRILWHVVWDGKYGVGSHHKDSVEPAPKIDKRSRQGKALAERMNQQTILKKMPRIYYVEDPYNGGYRVGRSDWAGDQFNIVPKEEFLTFKKVLEDLQYPLDDKTHDE
jgi:hypothetical protein